MFHYGWGGFGGFGGFWMIGGFLVMVGIIVLAVWVISSIVHGPRAMQRHDGQPGATLGGRPDARPTPNEILRERFARGEINEEEFERAKKALGPDQ